MLGKVEELLVILLIILVLFGGKKIPELARSIGSSIREVRKGIAGDDDKSANAADSASKADTTKKSQK